MSIAHDPTTATPDAAGRIRRFRLVRGGARVHDRVVAEPPPKQVLLSPRAARLVLRGVWGVHAQCPCAAAWGVFCAGAGFWLETAAGGGG